MWDTLKQMLINYLPAFACGFVFIFCTFKYIGKFTDVLGEIKEEKSMKKFDATVSQLLSENGVLKKDIDILINDLKTLKNDLKEQIVENEELRQEIKELERKLGV